MRRRIVLAAVVALAGCGSDREAPAAPAASTLERTLRDPDGDAALDPAPGEPLLNRTDIAPAAAPGEVLVTVAQLSDSHVRDEESPSRVPFLDRLGGAFATTFRPHEALSAQVLAAAVTAVNRQRPDAVLVTGDVTDNAQRNELRLAVRVLGGGRAAPDSGAPGYRGVQQAGNPDPFYYRPDVDPPRRPGLLELAQRPFDAAGLDAPWYGVAGNHDVLLQGELPPSRRTDAIAAGDQLVTALDPRARLPATATTAQAVDALLGAARGGRTVRVPADAGRRAATDADLVGALAGGRPTRVPDRLDYVVDHGSGVRFIVLDTTSRAGGQEGVVTGPQLGWLRDRLATDRHVIVVAHQPPGQELLRVLDRAPAVVAVLHGDSHRNAVRPRGRFWLVGTSSLADWPMQARMVRLRRAGSGLALETWMVDHDGGGLAGTARELAYLDAQGGRPRGLAGARGDRNVRLFVP